MEPKPKRMPVLVHNIPEPIKVLDRWVLWNWELDGDRWTKPPKLRSGRPAAVNDPEHWISFDEAMDVYSTGRWDGIGVVLPTGMVGIDLDDCIQGDGTLTQEAEMFRAMLPTYCERSPSWGGLKLIGLGTLNHKLGKTKKDSQGRGIELYDGGTTNRYFTITGNVWPGHHYPLTGQRESLYGIQSMITGPMEEIESYDPPADRTPKALEYLAALKPERAHEYSDWLKVGMALAWCSKSDAMLQKWIEWSRQSSKFQEGVCERKWESFRREEGRVVTLRSLEVMAKQDGYNPDKFNAHIEWAHEFLERKIEHDWIIDNVMAAQQPMVIGAPSKTLKTTSALDMALSIATGTPYLGKYAVSRPRTVLFFSGESGDVTLQKNLRAMVEARPDLDRNLLKRLGMSFRVPTMSDDQTLEEVMRLVRELQVEVLFVDPVYMSLDVGDNAGNVYAMGKMLRKLADRAKLEGVTLILLHHLKKQGRTHDIAPELEDLSQAGMAEFCRQFVLLKRFKPYEGDGKHVVWYTWGGSAGHGGHGILEAFTGLYPDVAWVPKLYSMTEWKQREKELKAMAKAAKEAESIDSEEPPGGDFSEGSEEGENAVLDELVLNTIGKNPALNNGEIVNAVNRQKANVLKSLKRLEEAGLIVQEAGKGRAKRWRLNLI